MRHTSDGVRRSLGETAVAGLARAVVGPTLDGSLPLPVGRRWLDLLGRATIDPRRPVDVRRGSIGGVRCEVVRPRGAARTAPVGAPQGDDHLLLYIHGGGFVVGSPRSHRPLAGALAHATGATVVVPDYRLAPEHPYPAAADDVLAVHAALGDRRPERLTVAGDSAGGNLAIGLAIALRDRGDRSLDALGAISPLVDMTMPPGSWDTSGDAVLRRGTLDIVAGYLAGARAPDDPLVSPRFADLADLPPTLVQVGGAEALHDDAVAFVDRVTEVGGDIHLQEWPGMFHVHQAFTPLMAAATHAIDDLGRFLAAGAIPTDAATADGVLPG
ncbi:alpha/beta hydrolase [Nitriliruptor alkaliphilus]|uniref:alpha/beta hydrolase n=1 Tax=Nitriliruptor alkaliphilus TaxID=427918 RepID=UPI000698512B|nr:alpha/beta hydrolase [Nitriliruptor alkaliphilus]